jgi:hypothetical protein
MSYDSASLTTPDIKWLGLRPSDLNRYNLPDQCRLDMTENDIKTGKELMREEFITKNPKWMKELEIMVRFLASLLLSIVLNRPIVDFRSKQSKRQKFRLSRLLDSSTSRKSTCLGRSEKAIGFKLHVMIVASTTFLCSQICAELLL